MVGNGVVIIKPKWILLEARKPKAGQICLVSTKHEKEGRKPIYKVHKDTWTKEDKFKNIPMEYITAWQPFPEPYKGEAE